MAIGVETQTLLATWESSIESALRDIYSLSPEKIHQLHSIKYLLESVSTGGSGPTAATATTTAIALSTTPVTLAAANANRSALTIHNHSDQILYILVGTGTVSSDLFTDALEATMSGVGAYYELPQAMRRLAVSGIWAAAGTGSAMVTEGI